MAIESAVNDVKRALESNDAKAIERTLDALMQAQQKAAEALYKTTGAPDAGAGAENGPTPGGGADDVIDAEIVDDKK
jgi:molecular chaperone DnaK